MKILLVEDDSALAATLAEALSDQNYTVDIASDGELALARARSDQFDLLLLDVMLPRLDGISLCKILRSERFNLPILMMTACGNSAEQVAGLDAGADDYVIKPVHLPVLFARLRALLRRNGSLAEQSHLTWGQIKIERERGVALFADRELPLTPKEYTLLEMLVSAGSRLVKREEIVQRVWAKEQNPTDDTLRSHIKSLRHKLRAADAPDDLIETVHSRGFRLNTNYQ
jgi:DNA-binding response OmpR family regulator